MSHELTMQNAKSIQGVITEQLEADKRKNRALGPQGAAVVDSLRVTVDPATGEPAAAAIRWPDFPPMGYGPEATAALRLQQLEAENAELRARVADLEHALRLADSERTQAVEAVEKRERMRDTRTRGGRIPSMWEAFSK